MLAPETVASDVQEPSLTDIQLQEEVPYHVSISGGLPQDSKQPPNSQPVRPWSAGSRPHSALGATRPRPTSAVRINNVAADGLHADGTEFVQQGATAVKDRPASPGHWIQSAPRARPQSSKGRARPASATSQQQQQQQQPTSTAQQQRLQHTMQQLQEQQDAHNSRTQLQIPRLNLINLEAASKIRSASFPQQGLLQAPIHKVPEVITDLVTAANSQNDVSRGYKGLGVQSASDSPAVAAAAVVDAAAVPASSPGKRQASVITIGVSPWVSNSSNVLSDADNGQTTVNTSTTELDGDLHDSSQQQWQLNVLGTIEEEDSVLRTQRQQQEDNLQVPRCASPVNLAADVSFDNCSYANSGQISPASPYNRQKQRPYSSSSSSSRRQQVSNSAAGGLNTVNHRNSGGKLLHPEQQEQMLQAVNASGSDEIEQRHHQQQQEESQNVGYEPFAADHSFYGALASDNYKPESRPWSAAATNAARKLYGAPTMQLAGAAQQQQHQQQRRCGSAHPYYSIDTRLMTRGAGVFSPNVSLTASRGAGFHVHTTRHNSSSRSTLPPHHSSSRSAAAAAAAARAAAAASLNSSLSASRCCSRQQQQGRQQSRSGSSHRYSDLSGDSVDLDLAGDLAGYGETLDDRNSDELYHTQQQQQQEQEQQLVNEVSLHSANNASQVSAAAAEQRDEVSQQQQQRSRSALSQIATGRDSPTAAGQISYRLPASRPVSAAAVVAAKQRSNQQARLASAKAATNLNTRPRSDYSRTARGGLAGGVGGRTAAAAAAGTGRGLRGVDTGIGQIVVSSSRRGSSRWH